MRPQKLNTDRESFRLGNELINRTTFAYFYAKYKFIDCHRQLTYLNVHCIFNYHTSESETCNDKQKKKIIIEK